MARPSSPARSAAARDEAVRDEAVRANARAWDATVRRHREHRGDEAERLARGEDPEEMLALDGAMRREIGSLRGLDLLHALCNHGATTVALARDARSALGIDLSREAIRDAEELARRTGSRAEFERAEALAFLRTTRRRFDAVVAAWGVLCWMPDVNEFARGVARVLRPGGFVHLLDGHPMANSALGVGGPRDPYFGGPRPGPRRERWTLDYYGPGHGVAVDIAWWQWTVGDVVTALCDAGLVVEFLHEFEGTHPCYYGSEVPLEVDGTAGHLPGRRGLLPLSFSVRARRPGAVRRTSHSTSRRTARASSAAGRGRGRLRRGA